MAIYTELLHTMGYYLAIKKSYQATGAHTQNHEGILNAYCIFRNQSEKGTIPHSGEGKTRETVKISAFDGLEFEQTLGVGDGQGSLACCGP